jgi:hypothetical protein
MKTFLLSLLIFFFTTSVNAQAAAVSADKMNVLYAGIDNPVTIVSANCPCNKIKVHTNIGSLTGRDCKYLFKADKQGQASISVSRIGAPSNKITVWQFRVKAIPDPIFKIGPYGMESSFSINANVLSAQQYVRAELENFDFDVRFRIDSFRVKILSSDSCKIKSYSIGSNRLPDEVRTNFKQLNESDIIVFDKIFAMGPDGIKRQLKPLILTIENYTIKN